MAISKIYPTNHFIKSYKMLSENIKTVAKKREIVFINNPFDKRLKTHKLKGKLKDYWSYSINYQYRILFRFLDKETVIYHDIGTHEIYK